MPSLSLIVTDLARLPTVLTGIALRVDVFTVTKMSTLRWQVGIPAASQKTIVDLLDVLPTVGVEVHTIDPT